MKPLLSASSSEKRDFAYEIKFLISETIAETALAWARKNLSPDPFAGGATSDCYCVNSVYLDTAGFDVYHRKGSFGRCKYRVRRYGTEPTVYLERKLKTRGLVGKRRSRVPDREVSLLEQETADPAWTGSWFHRRLLARALEPKCQIAYDRIARVGMAPEGPVRMTLDRNVRAFPTSQWHVNDAGPWRPLLTNQCILEMKFRTTLPNLFRGILDQLGVQPQAMSKYRLSVQTFGWDATIQPGIIVPVNGQAHPSANSNHSVPAQLWAETSRMPQAPD
ncbi:MAG: polyphosphate polymerase domain-containing protein [Verrucomicrobiales bacterium]|nr:polyphosphate polymerase domain-containing protein [Verrucomicrobiales bacterium]